MRISGVSRISALLFPLLLLSCSSSVYKEVYPTLVDGKYDSEFPYKACSKQLEQIGETVKMLSCIAYYRVYTLGDEKALRLNEITPEVLAKKAKQVSYVNNSTSGTATVIYAQDRRVVLLTCAHVVSFPDTIISYVFGPDRHPTPYIKSIAFREKQTNFVAVLPEGGDLEVLAIDRVMDIALLGRTFENFPSLRIPSFNYPFGRAKELEWGTFLYLFGYPSGYKIVTKGIVSSPKRDKAGSFLVDAVFNRGFSGGIALAIRDGVPNFELVGIIKLVSAHAYNLLVPEREDGEVEYDPSTPYTGPLYAERKTEIEYGITQSIPAEALVDFIEQARPELQKKGYALGTVLRPD